MGKVELVLPGRDGFIRSAELTTVNKSGNVVRVKRPIQELNPLEVEREQEKLSMDVHYEDILEYARWPTTVTATANYSLQ